jgi:hypothetical protein
VVEQLQVNINIIIIINYLIKILKEYQFINSAPVYWKKKSESKVVFEAEFTIKQTDSDLSISKDINSLEKAAGISSESNAVININDSSAKSSELLQ